MLYELIPQNWKPYVSSPTVEGGVLVLRSINDGGFGGALRHGVGAYTLPQYNTGDTLQWALLARTTTPPAVLDLVPAVAGSINNLGFYGLNIPPEWAWITTPPAVIDFYAPTLFLGIPELGKEVQVKTWLLGDPASITDYINPPAQPARERIWPWVIGAIAVGLLVLKRTIRGKNEEN